jgi:hypothetical protein
MDGGPALAAGFILCIALVSGALFTGACGLSPSQPGKAIHPTIATIQGPVPWERIATVERIVALETTPASALGRIGTVKVDERQGDILVLDNSSLKAVFRFSSDGRFIRKYGGHWTAVPIDIAVLRTGDLVVAVGRRLVLLSDDGRVKRSVTVPFVPTSLAAGREDLFVAGIPGPFDKERTFVYSFTPGLKLKDRLVPLDPRLLRFRFCPRRCLSWRDGHLYVADVFDYALTDINLRTGARRRYEPSSLIRPSHPLWQKATLSDSDRLSIHDESHLIVFVTAYKGGVFMYGIERGHKDLLLLDGSGTHGTFFTRLSLPAVIRDQLPTTRLTLESVTGEYDSGVIVTVSDAADGRGESEKNPQLAFLRCRAPNQ